MIPIYGSYRYTVTGTEPKLSQPPSGNGDDVEEGDDGKYSGLDVREHLYVRPAAADLR